MKLNQVVLALVALQMFSRVAAQVADFAPVGAKWYYSEQSFFPPPFGEFPYIVEVVSKEMYQGKLCSKLVGTGFTSNIPLSTVPFPLYVYSQNDSVFFYSLLSGQFELLYDFGAEAGDTWVIGGLGTPDGYDSLTVHVDSTSQLLINGNSLKVLHISYPVLPYEWGFEIIAGVGNTFFLTPDYGLYEGGPMGLRCYVDPENDLHLVSYPCDTTRVTSNTTDIGSDIRISVFPNPGKDYINILIATNTHNYSFGLFDQLGRLVRQMPVQTGMSFIETAGLNPGLYTWVISHENKPIKHGQIAKTLK